jgi:hypothetical protein
MDQNTMNIIANEARRQELRAKVAALKAEAGAFAVVAQILSSTNGDAIRRLNQTQNELAALEAGAGPGVTDNFGMRTSVDNFATEERTVGQGAAVDFIQANPECSEAEAVAAWLDGVAAWLPEGQLPTHSPQGLLNLYIRNLMAWGKLGEPTWDSFRAFVAITPKDVLLGM